MEVKDTARVVDRWKRNVQAASPDYEAGVKTPKRDWLANTIAAVANWVGGIQTAIANKLYEKGLRAAGTAKWQSRTLAVGLERWVPGVTAAVDAYRDAVEPYLSALRALTLPPRRAKGDPANYERVRAVGNALRTLKLTRMK